MELLELQLGGLLMVFSRMAGLFIFAPVLASVSVPMKVRALLCCGISLIVWLGMPPHLQLLAVPDVITAAYLIFTESTLGMIIGFIAMLPVVAVQLGSAVFGQQMGFGLAAVYNPALETESDVLGELMLYLAIGVFLAFGGLEHTFLAVANSFVAIPPGGFSLSRAPLTLVQGILNAGFALALRIAMPVLVLLLIETLASSLISKTMPQLNVMSLGFANKIILGMIALIGSLVAVHEILGLHLQEVWRGLLTWLSTPVAAAVAISPGALL